MKGYCYNCNKHDHIENLTKHQLDYHYLCQDCAQQPTATCTDCGITKLKEHMIEDGTVHRCAHCGGVF